MMMYQREIRMLLKRLLQGEVPKARESQRVEGICRQPRAVLPGPAFQLDGNMMPKQSLATSLLYISSDKGTLLFLAVHRWSKIKSTFLSSLSNEPQPWQ